MSAFGGKADIIIMRGRHGPFDAKRTLGLVEPLKNDWNSWARFPGFAHAVLAASP